MPAEHITSSQGQQRLNNCRALRLMAESWHSLCLKKWGGVDVGEIVQYKHEDPNLISSTHVKKPNSAVPVT